MASGIGAYGGTSQCYRFWVGFSQCRLQQSNPTMCLLEQADYMECLHRDKLKRRIATKLMEVKKQESGEGSGAAAHGGGGHH